MYGLREMSKTIASECDVTFELYRIYTAKCLLTHMCVAKYLPNITPLRFKNSVSILATIMSNTAGVPTLV